MSGTGQVVVIDYDTGRKVVTIEVGDHPQRFREGVVTRVAVHTWR